MTTIKEQAREARAAGLKSFEGPPCRFGHTTRRANADGSCAVCHRVTVRRAIMVGDVEGISRKEQRLRLDLGDLY
jgi:hypothetical protein